MACAYLRLLVYERAGHFAAGIHVNACSHVRTVCCFFCVFPILLSFLHVYHVHSENELQHWPFWIGTLVAVVPSYWLAIDTGDRDGPLGINLYNCWATNTMLSPRASAMMLVRLAEGSIASILVLALPPLPGRYKVSTETVLQCFGLVASMPLTYVIFRKQAIKRQRATGCKACDSPMGREPEIYDLRPNFDFGFLHRWLCLHACKKEKGSGKIAPEVTVTSRVHNT